MSSSQKTIQLDSLPSFCSSTMNNNDKVSYNQQSAPSIPTQSDNDEASLHGLFRSKGSSKDGYSQYHDQSDSGDSIGNTRTYQHSKNRNDKASTFFNNSQASSASLKLGTSRQIATNEEEHKMQSTNEFSAQTTIHTPSRRRPVNTKTRTRMTKTDRKSTRLNSSHR